ncbi:gamma carbonic anhydrase family protein [Clostridium sp. P21]|uniref:Gamma carbonic anhydrase family protein n=1 Tax=Clostridium muellerianum TaxID=2716538 RepID=A0A7Y0EGB3_9CLOT|nr:gamma carbonic anhydrase family protein [Clostridium muellerianum]NMM62887.1 gamma carbonic anhydrase family protein [Clostridium muellerianum]
MIIKYKNINPKIDENAFMAHSADIIGKVTLEKDVSIWFGAVLRGDCNSIYIGKGSNIQDNCTVHVGHDSSVEVGEYVTVGHNAVIHGCKINDYCLIGMGSTIMNDAEIGTGTIIGAGSLVTEGKKIPSGVLCMGSPARVVRELTEKEREYIINSAHSYIEESRDYK